MLERSEGTRLSQAAMARATLQRVAVNNRKAIPSKKVRVGILDFFNIQNSERQKGMSRSGNALFKKSLKGFSLLSRAIRELGHIPVLYYPEHAQLFFDDPYAEVLYKGKEVKGCDVLIPRINVVSQVELEISVIKQFELKGIPVVNKSLPIATALNKLRSLQVLTEAGIPVPKTIVVRRFEYLDDAIKMLGGYPVVIKAVFGTHGKRVAILESRRSLYSALDILWKYSNSRIILLQEYIEEADGADYRAFVVGNRVVAAMKRTAAVGDFRSNLNLGGDAAKVKLTREEEQIALRASKAFDLDTCGVDLLRTRKGPVVMEMNPCAGLAGITKSTSIDVASELVRHALTFVHKN